MPPGRDADDLERRALERKKPALRGHIHSCKRFAAFLNRSPDTATTEDIRRFQLHLAEACISICNRNRIMTGLRFLFRVTLRLIVSSVTHIGNVITTRVPLGIRLVSSIWPP